jgi:DNA-binding response OmpR family regulator
MLIVDNESMGRTLALILEEKGCIMDAAETGEEATRKSMENFYNLALIGIGLLDMEKKQDAGSIK